MARSLWSDRPLGVKLAALVAAGASALGVFAVVTVGALQDTGERTDEVLASAEVTGEVLLADMMHDAVRTDVLQALLSDGAGELYSGAVSDLADTAETFHAIMAEALSDDLSPAVNAAVETVAPAVEACLTSAAAIVTTAGSDPLAAEAAYPQFSVAFSALEEELPAMGDAVTALAESAATRSRPPSTRSPPPPRRRPGEGRRAGGDRRGRPHGDRSARVGRPVPLLRSRTRASGAVRLPAATGTRPDRSPCRPPVRVPRFRLGGRRARHWIDVAGETAGDEDEASVERAAGERVQRSVLPVPRPPDAAATSHAAAVVGSDEEILAAALPFLAHGLAAGDTTVLACPDEIAALIRTGLGVDGAAVQNLPRIGLRDTRAPDALTVTRRLLEQARSTGSGRVRLVGQVQFGEQPRAWREGARYEAARNVLLARSPLAGLCLYDSRILPAEILDCARATHPELVVGGERRSSPDFGDPRDFLRRLPVPREPVEDTAPVLAVPAATALADLRHRLGAALSAHVADPDLADDLHLAVSEVAANAFRHGVPPVSARMWVGPDQLICEIGDRGSAFADPLAGFQPAHGPDLGRGGMGLWLARKLFDHVDLVPGPGGLVVRLATRVPG